MIVILAAHAVAALIAIPLVLRLGRRAFPLLALVPAASAVWVAANLNGTPTETVPWAPGIHLALDLRMDSLSALMALIALGVGEQDGVERGHVLSLFRNRGTAIYRGEDGKESYNLPEKRYGLVFVFRVFNRVSYALVMETDGPVSVGDAVRKP